MKIPTNQKGRTKHRGEQRRFRNEGSAPEDGGEGSWEDPVEGLPWGLIDHVVKLRE